MSPRARGQGKTPHHHLRAEHDLWDGFGNAVKRQGEPDRSAVLRAFMAWYQRLPGAKLPKRPEAAPPVDNSGGS